MNESDLLAFFQGFAVLIGLTLGSFCNVAIDRLPHDRSLLPRSACDTCGHHVRPIDLVPVLSYALLRGRCRDCGASIGAHVPLVELLVGLLSWSLMRRLVPTADLLDRAHLAAWAVFLVFTCMLVVATYSDIRHRIIPDETSIYAVPVGIGAGLLLDSLGYEGWLAHGWRSAIIGAMLGAGVLTLAAIVARVIRGADALGWGDVKLLAMIGAFLGPIPGVWIVLIISSMLGLALGLFSMIVLRTRWMPYGPALAVSAVIYVLYGDVLILEFFPHGMAVVAGLQQW